MTPPAPYELIVLGTPAPKGSNRFFKNGGVAPMSKALAPWTEAIRSETQRARQKGGLPKFDGPVELELTFTLRRPAGHHGTGRNAGQLKKSAPAHPTGTPDVDKLARAVLDGLTAGGAWNDDAQVVWLSACKQYGRDPGCLIRIAEPAPEGTENL